ncbi:MAG: TonB-dependent receptor [Methylomarinum sp.]|nr:TonB-dependent receptor [Methylomarinum sp.]
MLSFVARLQRSGIRGIRVLSPLLHFVLYGLLVSVCQANTADMQMHIFEEEAVQATSDPGMQMVIYTNEDIPTTDGQQLAYFEESTNNDEDIQVEFYADAGYRQDEFDWNKAHPSGTPNVLSELSWNDIEIAVIEIGTRVQTPSNWVMDARFAYGTIFDGDNQDSDWFGNNRTDEFSRSNNNADEGNTIDTSIGFGYQLTVAPSPARFKKPILSFTPKIGFSYHAQNFTITDGFQTIPATGNFAGLDSSYDASWYGPWIGFDSELSIADWYSLTTTLEYHYAYYEGSANWNLRTDFAHPISFEQEAEGSGLVASLGSQFRLSRDLSLNVSVDYQDWRADKKGIDKIFFADGSTAEMKFNEVNWQSMGANIGLRYQF